MSRRPRTRTRQRGQAAAEHVSLLAVVAVLVTTLGALAAGPLPRRVVAALADATARRVPPRHDDAWALTSPTWGPTIRRYAPRLVLERDVHGEDASVPVDPRGCRVPACAVHGRARPTVFVHLKRLPDAAEIAYWFYYPDSRTSHLPLRALQGFHADDWEGLIVRLDGRGARARATAHGGFHGQGPWWEEASGWRPIAAHPLLHRAAGSHAGGFDRVGIDLAGDDWNGTLAVVEPRALELVAADLLPAARLRYDPETTPPWRKRAWVDADVPGTSESGARAVHAEAAARWAAAHGRAAALAPRAR